MSGPDNVPPDGPERALASAAPLRALRPSSLQLCKANGVVRFDVPVPLPQAAEIAEQADVALGDESPPRPAPASSRRRC
eukprot:6352869-Pyramimonas_sp.AAC.1